VMRHLIRFSSVLVVFIVFCLLSCSTAEKKVHVQSDLERTIAKLSSSFGSKIIIVLSDQLKTDIQMAVPNVFFVKENARIRDYLKINLAQKIFLIEKQTENTHPKFDQLIDIDLRHDWSQVNFLSTDHNGSSGFNSFKISLYNLSLQEKKLPKCGSGDLPGLTDHQAVICKKRLNYSRQVSDMEETFTGGPGVLKSIRNILKNRKEKDFKVLEIGMGSGRFLLELQKLFPKIQTYGINKEKDSLLSSNKELMSTALFFDIFTRETIKDVHMPKLYFMDLSSGKLPFKDNFFDLVVSQATIMFLERKDTLINEVWRTLKPSGVAFLNTSDNFEITHPQLENANCALSFLNELKKENNTVEGISRLNDRSLSNIIFTKRPQAPLVLNLKYLPEKSYWNDAKDIDGEMGWHSVYSFANCSLEAIK